MRSLVLVVAWLAAMRWISKALAGSRLDQALMGACCAQGKGYFLEFGGLHIIFFFGLFHGV